MITLDSQYLPKAEESEPAVCFGCMMLPTSMDVVGSMLEKNDFYHDGFGSLFVELREMHTAGKPINDVAMVADACQRFGILQATGGVAGLSSRLRSVAPGHELFHAIEIRKASILRAQQRLGLDIIAMASKAKQDPGEVAAYAEAALSGMGLRITKGARLAYNVAQDLVEEIKTDMNSQSRGVLTGLSTVDRNVGAFMPGELTLLAARTSVGKTSLGTQFACHAADRGIKSLIVSLEMRDSEVVSRIISSDSGVDGRDIRTRRLTNKNINDLQECANALKEVPLSIWAPPSATVEQIRAMAKLEQSRNGLRMLVVDYVGRVRATDPKRDRHEQVSHISGMLKTIAVELNIPVLALVQLNRDADGQIPRISQLRDSGSLEQDADVVLMLHRADLSKPEADLIVGKHRHGITGRIRLTFDGKSTRYLDEVDRMARDNRQSTFDEFNASPAPHF